MKKLLIAVLVSTTLIGCVDQSEQLPKKKVTESAKAQRAAESIKFTENAEIENIKRRLELTSNPGLVGYIVVLNRLGVPVVYEGVKGKITSGSKRLTKEWAVYNTNHDCGQDYCDHVGTAPSDEGTFGRSNPYVFYWNTNGAYRQTNMEYIYSNQPLRLREEPLVINIEQPVPQEKADEPGS